MALNEQVVFRQKNELLSCWALVLGLGVLLFSCLLNAGCSASKEIRNETKEKIASAKTGLVGVHDDVTTSVAVSPDGLTIASGASPGEIKLWDVSSGNLLQTIRVKTPMPWRLAFSPDSTRLFGGGLRGDIFLWDIVSGSMVWEAKHGVNDVSAVAYSSDGKWVASAGSITESQRNADTQGIKLWRADTGESIGKVEIDGLVKSLQFTIDNTLIIVTHKSSLIAEVLESDISSTLKKPRRIQVLKSEKRVTHSVISPSGKFVITAGREGNICVWNIGQSVAIPIHLQTTGIITALAISSDGQKLVSAVLSRHKDKLGSSLLLWDLATGTIVDSLQRENVINDVFFSPDSNWVGFIHWKSVAIWNLKANSHAQNN